MLGFDISNKWSPEDIKCLITLYKTNIEKFDEICKNKVWGEIAEKINNIREKKFTANQCTGKWKGLKSMYKSKVKDHNNTSGNGTKHWEYFEEMDEILYKRPEIHPPATCSSDDITVQINRELTPSTDTFEFDDVIMSDRSIPTPSASRA